MGISRKKLCTAVLLSFLFSFMCFVPNWPVEKGAILACFLTTILFWGIGGVPKWVPSLFILLGFCMFSKAPFERIFMFPLSRNFLMIIFSYLFSQGLKNSHIFDLLIPYFQKRIKGIVSFVVSVLFFALVAVWVIPQPFARIIIVLQVYTFIFEHLGVSEDSKGVLFFYVVISMLTLNCAFLRGDIILNYALLNVSRLSLTEHEWLKWMFIPTIIFYAFESLLFIFLFRKEFGHISWNFPSVKEAQKRIISSRSATIIASLTILAWITEPITGIPAAYSVAAASVAMFATELLKISDLKSIDLELMLFLTAAFSIGPVMSASGFGEILTKFLSPVLPQHFNLRFVIILIAMSMAVHMVLGSCVTTISVLLPTVMLVCSHMPQIPVAFVAFIPIVTHFFMPVHNVSLMVGSAGGRYSDITVLKYGCALTVFEFLAIPGIYLTYWIYFDFMLV